MYVCCLYISGVDAIDTHGAVVWVVKPAANGVLVAMTSMAGVGLATSLTASGLSWISRIRWRPQPARTASLCPDSIRHTCDCPHPALHALKRTTIPPPPPSPQALTAVVRPACAVNVTPSSTCGPCSEYLRANTTAITALLDTHLPRHHRTPHTPPPSSHPSPPPSHTGS